MALALLIVLVSSALSVIMKKLTRWAGVTGALLAFLVFAGCGWTGLALLGTFFLLGVLATRTGKSKKRTKGTTHEGESRDAGQVLANGGVAGLCSAFAYIFSEHAFIFQLGAAGALSAATADTLSSELGNAWGRRYYDILTLHRTDGGPDGVVSSTGIFCGMVGSLVIGFIFVIGYALPTWYAVVVLLAGTIGNLADSLLGATVERRGILANNQVNAANTFAGAISAAGLYALL